MVFRDIREFIKKLDELSDIKIIKGADWNLEIGAITEIMAETSNHALLFDEIKSYPQGWRVMTNIVNHPMRAALALGLPTEVRGVEIVRAWRQMLKTFRPIPPVEVDDGPVLQNVQEGEEVDLMRFPVPKWHGMDGGRYIGTACVEVTRDPTEGSVNLGCYRVQIHDRNTLALHIVPGKHGRIIAEKFWSAGKKLPIVVTFGQDPTTWIASTLSVPDVSDLDIVGWARGEPFEFIEGQLTKLPIPATAEIAIEGEVPPPEKRSLVEGPFGEGWGYYAHGARSEAVIEVKRVMHRDTPILTGAPPMKPPLVWIGLPMQAAGVWEDLEKAGVPDIKGVYDHVLGGRFLVISIKQHYAGHATQAAMAALGSRYGAYHGRFVIVVDDDIDISNIHDVIWAVITRCDPETSISIIPRCWSTLLDPRIPPEQKAKGDLTSSRAVIDACKPYHWIKEFPPTNAFSSEFKQEVKEKWAQNLS